MSAIPIIEGQEERDLTLRQSPVRHIPAGAAATLEVVLNRLHGWPRPLVLVFTLLFATLIAIVDYALGDKVPLIVLYLPVVAVACWVVNLGTAYCVSAICSSLWLVDDMVIDGAPWREFGEYWIMLTHFVFFSVIATSLTRLRVVHEREERNGRTDSLTGLPNSRFFTEAVYKEISRSHRSGRPLTLAFLDCDNFKYVNDQFGHLVGDTLLQTAATTLKSAIRPMDIVARLGGDEFAILLPDASGETAKQTLLRLQAELNQAMQAAEWPVTFSVGVVTFHQPPESVTDMIRVADDLMYAVKRKGKNATMFQVLPKPQGEESRTLHAVAFQQV